MTTNADLHRRRLEAIPRGIGTSFPIYVDRARNAELWDVEGTSLCGFRRRHRRPQHRSPPSPGAGGRGRPTRPIQPYLLHGHPLRVGGHPGRETQPPGTRSDPQEDGLLQLGGRGGGERGEGRPQLHRPARRHRLLRQLPWSHPHGPRPHRQGPSVQGGLRAISGRRSSRSLSLSVPGSKHGRRPCRSRANLQGRHGARASGGDPDRTGARGGRVHTGAFRLHQRTS